MCAETRAEPRAETPVEITLEHVGVAVDGLDAAAARWATLLSRDASAVEDVAGEGVRVRFIEAGAARIELIESARADSAIARFLARRGPGLHHLSFRVAGAPLGAWFAALRRRGVRLVGDAPHAGSGGTQVFFVHPEAAGGVLIEFSQRRPTGDAAP